MQANPKTVNDLFNSQVRYVVPMFQRQYVWQAAPQWTTLWEDIVEKAELRLGGIETNPHYLGALIIEGVRPDSPREVKRFLVIDGQQRLTTLQLLLCAFRDIARAEHWTHIDRALTRYLENSDVDVMEAPDQERFKVWPTTLNRGLFSAVVLAGSRASVETAFPLVRIGRRKKPEPRSNLVEAYMFYAGAIGDWLTSESEAAGGSREDCAFALLQAIQQDLCVVEIGLSEGDDSQEIFYSLNSQGRPLSQSDLLRSLVFMRAEKEKLDRDEIFDQYWGQFETPFWSTELKRAGRTVSRLDLALRLFLMAKTGAMVDARRVNEEYRRWMSKVPRRYPSVKNELADFSGYCEVYRNYESELSLPCTDLRRVLRDFDVSTVLPLIMFLERDAQLSASDLSTCLREVESFLARRVLTGDETKEYNQFFVEVVAAIRTLKGADVALGLREKLRAGGGTTRRWPEDGAVIEAAVSRPLFGRLKTPALRLILERLEVFLRTKKSEGHDLPVGLQIEHVIPQKWGKHWTLDGHVIPENVVLWPFLAADELAGLREQIRFRSEKLHTLGNLTLLNEYLNPAASNGPFDLKLVEYKHSVLRLNRYFDGKQAWDEEQISKRGQVLGQACCEIWPGP